MPVVNYHTVNGQLVGQSTGTEFTQYLTDAQGSVTATVNGKRVTNTYRYKPYGERLAKTGSGPDPAFQWAGDTGSRVTGRSWAEQYNQARHYGTRQSSWTSVDPIWPSEKAYSFGAGNPTTFIDPTGNSPVVIQICAFIGKWRATKKPKWFIIHPNGLFVDTSDYVWGQAALKCKLFNQFTIDSCSIGVDHITSRFEVGQSEYLFWNRHLGSFRGGLDVFKTNSKAGCNSAITYESYGQFGLPPGVPKLPTPVIVSNGHITIRGQQDQVTVTLNVSRTQFPDFLYRVSIGGVTKEVRRQSSYARPELGLSIPHYQESVVFTGFAPTRKEQCCGTCP